MARLFRLTVLAFLILTPLAALAAAPDLAGNLAPVINEYYDKAALFAVPIAIAVLIFAGYRYITSTGNPEALGEAKGLMTGAIVGLVVLLLAKLILNTIG